MYIPGFRSKKPIKITIAIIYYVFSLLMLFAGISYALFLISLPFIAFYGIDLLNKQKLLVCLWLYIGLCYINNISTNSCDTGSNTSNNLVLPSRQIIIMKPTIPL